MNRLPTGLLSIAVMLGATLVTLPASEAASPPVKFGMDAASVSAQSAAGVKPDYGTLWIGPWTLSSGWGGPDSTLATLKSKGVTPAVHFYYWGDDISPSCVENGCWSGLHNTWKDRAKWKALGDQLAWHLHAKLGGAPAVVFLESEFNKRGISTYEPFDGYLAEMAYRLKGAYPAAQIVLGFGNWQPADWWRFDRAAAASQMVGLQAMRGATKDSWSSYNTVYDATLTGARKLQGLFHKPIMLTDLALSSHWEPQYSAMQRDNLQKFFSGIGALRDAGVQAMVYRSWYNAPGASTANHYGEAERHWGLAYSGTWHKAAAKVWVDGVKAVRGGAATASAPSGSSFAADFTAKAVGNDWWLETNVASSSTVTKVEGRVNGGSWVALDHKDWGSWARSVNAPNGAQVQFRAWSSTGASAYSALYTWT